MLEPIELSARQRRSALEALPRERLARITGRYDLRVADRRSAASHVDAIVRAKRVDFAEVLGLLGRDELKAVCEALGLDTSGRQKQTLLDRVLGRSSNGAGAETRNTVAARPRHTNGAQPNPGAKLTREQLEGYLWAAADILRGSIDSSDYKNFIFGLLFLKRLSDRFDEECEQLVAEGIDPEQHDEHQFFVPKRARWSQIQKGATGLGELLNKASAALEEANAQALEGVLAGIDYNDERKLGDSRQRDNVLHRLVLHFSKINLRNDHLAEPDMLGRAYEYLIEKFADDAGKKGGEFYTPHMVVRLIVEALEPKEGMRICDPTCGSGGMLIQAGKYIVEHGGRPHNFSLFGQEKNLGTWAICKMNMLLHGYPDARIEKGDVIRDPKLLEDGALMLFDRVIANPPFSQKDWGYEIASNDPFGRYGFGVPPMKKQGSDLAFLSHMIQSLAGHGMAGVILPHGALFRGGTEADIRRRIVENDLLEAVIGLPPDLFYGTPIPAAILIINRSKAAVRIGRVLFVDASLCFEKGINQDRLRPKDLATVVDVFKSFREMPNFARVVSRGEIEAAQHEWRIETFVGPSAEAATVNHLGVSSVLRMIEDFSTSNVALAAAVRGLGTARTVEASKRTDLGSCPSTWNVLSFAELTEQVRLSVDVNETSSYRQIGVRSHGRGLFHKEPVSGKALGNKKVFWVKPGCLIFNVIFGWEGAVAVTTEAEEGMVASHRFPMFRPKSALIDLNFLRVVFQSRPGVAALGRISPGGAGRNKTMNQGSLGKLLVGFPDLATQRRIVAIATCLEDSIESLGLMTERLAATRKGALELLGLGRLSADFG